VESKTNVVLSSSKMVHCTEKHVCLSSFSQHLLP
jgi:hypothetical protein